MKKIKTAKEYNTEFWNELSDDTTIIDVIKQAQLDMLEYVVNKCLSNAYAEESRIGYVWEVNEQSILKTIDEIKKELE